MTISARGAAVIIAALALVGLGGEGFAVSAARIPLRVEDLELHGVSASPATHEGRRAVRLVESDDRRTTGMAVVKGARMDDGTIALDVAGRRGPFAKDDDRGFVGIAFRVSATADRYEYFYIRPDNGRADEQERRNHATQYASYPDHPWPVLRKAFPGRYEAYADVDSGMWTALRVEVRGATARLYVNRAPQPVLIVNDLRLPPGEGGVGLWIGAGTEAFIANLTVARRAVATPARALAAAADE